MNDPTNAIPGLPNDGLELEGYIWYLTPEALSLLEAQLLTICPPPSLCIVSLLRDVSDETLALAIQKGFFLGDSFEELFHKRGTRYVSRWFRSKVRAEDALELCQELSLRFWENQLSTFNCERGTFAAYLRRSALRLLFEKNRKRRPTSVPVEFFSDMEGGDSDQDIVAYVRQDWLSGAISQLPAELQQLVQLLLKGFSSEDIAMRLNLSIRAVYDRTHKAKEQLRELLKD